MTTRNVNCMILVCDGCKRDYDHDWTPHYDNLVDAREESINLGEWRTDGQFKDWCPSCQKAEHECEPDPEDRQSCARCGEPTGGDPS